MAEQKESGWLPVNINTARIQEGVIVAFLGDRRAALVCSADACIFEYASSDPKGSSGGKGAIMGLLVKIQRREVEAMQHYRFLAEEALRWHNQTSPNQNLLVLSSFLEERRREIGYNHYRIGVWVPADPNGKIRIVRQNGAPYGYSRRTIEL